jgi:hypothetical protein
LLDQHGAGALPGEADGGAQTHRAAADDQHRGSFRGSLRHDSRNAG